MTGKLGKKLVIATHNAGKLAEITNILAPYGLECVSARDLGLDVPEETGTTFAENALIKARAAAKAANLPALADDSGLSLAALGGRPGVYTADWAERQWFEGPPGRDWFMAMGKVEGMLQALGEDADRRCWFTCVLAIAWPDGTDVSYEGKANGTFVWPPRGDKGFGYDPIFIPDGYSVTFGEMAPEEKHKISHRADAFIQLVHDQFEN